LFEGSAEGKTVELDGLGWAGHAIQVPMPALGFDVARYLHTTADTSPHETVDVVRYRATRHRCIQGNGVPAVAYVPEGSHLWR
jgi:hypothetical protein